MREKNFEGRKKGRSLIAVPENYILVDLETTGFSSRYDEIIEVGLIKIRGGQEVDRYQTLVKPSKPIPYIVELITGIRNEMVADAPTFNEIGKAVWDFLDNEIIVGHNINFDINFLYDKFEEKFQRTLQNDYVDTMRLAKYLIPEIKTQCSGNYGLDYLCEYLGIGVEKRHRAIEDCLCTENLLKRLKEIVNTNGINLSEVDKKNKSRNTRNISEILKSLKSEGKAQDASHMFYGKCCVFTGKLELFSRIEAAQIVVNIGGHCENSVTKRTNFLIVGDMDYKAGLEGYESAKLKKARKLMEEKQEIQIIPESAFYDLIDDYLEEE